MLEITFLSKFFDSIEDDPRINARHICIYAVLLKKWKEQRFANPVSFYGHEIMISAKISGSATYYKCIKELSDYGYIKYIPSFNHFFKSSIFLIDLK